MLNKKKLTMMRLLIAITVMLLSMAAFIFTVNAAGEDASLSGGAVESVYSAGSVFKQV